MSKIQALRETILAAGTEKPIESDQLYTFIRDGGITDTGAGLRYEATAIVIVTDWLYSPHPIARALALWLRTHENAERDALKFEVDVMGGDMVDLQFTLPFTEAIVFDGTEFVDCAAAVPDPDQFLPR